MSIERNRKSDKACPDFLDERVQTAMDEYDLTETFCSFLEKNVQESQIKEDFLSEKIVKIYFSTFNHLTPRYTSGVSTIERAHLSPQ